MAGNKQTQVKPVTKKETEILDGLVPSENFERQINGAEIVRLRETRLDFLKLIEVIIKNAVLRQKKANKDYLNIEILFDRIEKSMTVTDNSVGLENEDVASLVLESRFGASLDDTVELGEYDENLSLLELAAYYGDKFELLTKNDDYRRWIHIDFNDVMNLEVVNIEDDLDEKNDKIVKQWIKNSGVKYKITQIPTEFESGRILLPIPEELEQLRVQISKSFEHEMEDFDLVIDIAYRVRINQENESVFEKKKEKGFFGRLFGSK